MRFTIMGYQYYSPIFSKGGVIGGQWIIRFGSIQQNIGRVIVAIYRQYNYILNNEMSDIFLRKYVNLYKE
jgi:hypothetical protein